MSHTQNARALTDFEPTVGHPLRVTKAGRADELETLKAIQRGLDDLAAGRTVDAAVVHRRLREL